VRSRDGAHREEVGGPLRADGARLARVSARSRAAPWFRAPASRYVAAVAQYERERRSPAPSGQRLAVERPHCEQCGGSEGAAERAAESAGGVICVGGVLRLRAILCGRCLRLLRQ
jgi:hypothetical protein